MDPTCVLVTGGAGFIGSNFIRWTLNHDRTVKIINVDALTYAGNLESLADIDERFGASGEGRYTFVQGDVCDFTIMRRLISGDVEQEGRHAGFAVPNAIVHFAAESHVDRSILGPEAFVTTNINGTFTLLEACRAALKKHPRKFLIIQVSTDEVFGSLGPNDPPFTEETPLAPNSPYSASKAGADLLVRAYGQTFELPVIITRCSNNYGPFQFPEKLIPLMITRALRNQPLPVYGDGMNVRDWLHVEDHAEALWTILTRGSPGATYNIGGEAEVPNLELVTRLLKFLGKPESLIKFVPDRPGHDLRYAMNIERVRRDLSWSPKHTLEEGLAETVTWYLENKPWWERVLSEAYRTTTAMYMAETQ